MVRWNRNWVLAAIAVFFIAPSAAPDSVSAQCGPPMLGPCAFVQDSSRPPPEHGKLANRLDEIGPILSKCLRLPAEEFARPGMQITVRLSFTRDGEILGEPRFTFITPGVSAEIKAAYQRAIVDMLNRCTPLPITRELGGAIAGRPFVVPIVDTRKEKRAGY
jgi:hypothetical protein